MLRARENEDVEFVLSRMSLPMALPSVVPSLIPFVEGEYCAHLLLILIDARTEHVTWKPRVEGFVAWFVAGASTTRYYIGECKGVSEVHASRLSVGWPKFTERHDIHLCS